MHPRPSQHVPELERRLHRWVRQGLITEEAAGAIWAFEQARTPEAMPAVASASARRVPVLAEVIGYLGAALAGAAAAVLVARTWDRLSPGGRLIVPGVGALVFLLAGLAIHRNAEPAVQRLASTLWLLAAAGAGWFSGILAADVANASQRAAVLSVGATLAVAGSALYAYRRWPLQQLPVLVGLGVLLCGAFFDREVAIGVSLTALGVVWATLGALHVVSPARAGLVLGAVLSIWAPLVGMEQWTGGAVILGVVVAAGVVALGAIRHEGVALGIGVVGLFLYLVRAITYYLKGSAATALGFLVVGIGLMALAVIAMRTRHGPPRPAHG